MTMPQATSQSMYVPTVNAKMVDNIDSISANDVPMQGISVFPKNDLSEVYVKSWQPNGTISTIRYVKSFDTDAKTIQGDNLPPTDNNVATKGKYDMDAVMDKLVSLEEKVDKLSVTRKKKEVEE